MATSTARPSYVPDVPPQDITEGSEADRVLRYVRREFDKLARGPSNTTFFQYLPLNVAPSLPQEGMVVFADGTNWNPGSGRGLYEYSGGVWIFLAVIPATKSDQQAGTSGTKFVSPLHQQDHDSAAKAWVEFSVAATVVTVNKSYNVTSVVRTAVGDFTINFTVAFDSASYTFGGASRDSLANAGHMSGPFTTAPTASAFRVATFNFAGTLVDPAYASAVFFGRQ